MALVLDEHTLEQAAATGEFDYEKWPAIIEPLLQRLNQIVYTEFPTPKPYPIVIRPIPSSPSQTQPTLLRDSNAPSQTPSTPVRTLPPVPPFPHSSATSTSHVPDSLPPSQDPPIDIVHEIPTLLLQMLNSVTQILRASFSERPPHTVQRLAELILYPTHHYKTLPAWLRAVDRVVSVSSAADIFPLSDTPPVINGVNGDGGGGILWNNNDVRNSYDSSSLGSDESLGGALLTPIPWLRNGHAIAEDSSEDSIHLDSNVSASTDGLDDPLALVSQAEVDPLVPDRPNGAVTQGELIRLEQESGVVPVTRTPSDTHVSGTMEDNELLDEGDMIPHARGPDLLGSVDMGRVDGQDVQLHIGSPPGEEGKQTDPNNAQTVLRGDISTTTTTAAGMTESIAASQITLEAEDFEIVLKDTVEGPESDAMQLDDQIAPPVQCLSEENDGDIVLVDADGKSEDDPANKPGSSSEKVGADGAVGEKPGK